MYLMTNTCLCTILHETPGSTCGVYTAEAEIELVQVEFSYFLKLWVNFYKEAYAFGGQHLFKNLKTLHPTFSRFSKHLDPIPTIGECLAQSSVYDRISGKITISFILPIVTSFQYKFMHELYIFMCTSNHVQRY